MRVGVDFSRLLKLSFLNSCWFVMLITSLKMHVSTVLNFLFDFSDRKFDSVLDLKMILDRGNSVKTLPNVDNQSRNMSRSN